MVFKSRRQFALLRWFLNRWIDHFAVDDLVVRSSNIYGLIFFNHFETRDDDRRLQKIPIDLNVRLSSAEDFCVFLGIEEYFDDIRELRGLGVKCSHRADLAHTISSGVRLTDETLGPHVEHADTLECLPCIELQCEGFVGSRRRTAFQFVIRGILVHC